MSYIKLDRTQIKYPKKTKNPFIFVSEVVDSDCSFVIPKLITSSDELDIYFGNSFTQRDYYNELLHYGASLLLYKPIKEGKYTNETPKEYNTILDYTLDPPAEKDYIFFDNLPENGIPEGEDEPGDWKFYVSTEGTHYVWYEGEYIKIEDIPMEENLSSLVNRDTLRLTTKSFSKDTKFSYCHPKYRSRSYTPEYTEDVEDFSESLLQSIYSHGIDDETRSIAFTLDFTEVREFKEKDYIVFPLSSEFSYSRVQFYFGNSPVLGSDIIGGSFSFKVEGETVDDKISRIVSSLGKSKEQGGFGYKVIKEGPKKYTIFTSDMIQDQRFYTVEGLVFSPNFEVTQNIYSILSEDHKRLELYSKTIGPGDEDIKIKIEKLKGKFEEHYRFTISRYSYTEVFEGPIKLEIDSDNLTFTSLEKMINQGSKLVEMKVYDSDEELVPGEYYLRRAKSEKNYTPEDYWRALEKLQEIDISEDFLLVPEIEKYEIRGASSDLGWIYEYEKLLEYANQKNCQVLISNHPWKYGCTELRIVSEKPENPEEGIMYGVSVDNDTILYQTYTKEDGWRIYNSDPEHKYQVHEIEEAFGKDYIGNHIFNYTKDKWNRLVYFYKDMTFFGYPRPAYYIFLKGLLTRENIVSVNDILYESPTKPYEEETSNLQEYKSNFLSCNDHIFYYKEFFNHTGDWKYEVTILTRFCMNKVTNTVLREFPAYLGSETSGEILRGLNGILENLKRNYPIIHSLEIDYIEEKTQEQTLSVYLNLNVKEMLENDIKLSVTLNFNNN